MVELTPGQREFLFQLVRYQQKSQLEIVFAMRGGWDAEVLAWDAFLEGGQQPLIIIHREVVDVWAQSGLIHVSKRALGGGPFAYDVATFVLRKEALDYDEWMRKPAIVRGLITTWRRLVEDVPSLVWGVFGGVIGSIATALISRWAGLT